MWKKDTAKKKTGGLFPFYKVNPIETLWSFTVCWLTLVVFFFFFKKDNECKFPTDKTMTKLLTAGLLNVPTR